MVIIVVIASIMVVIVIMIVAVIVMIVIVVMTIIVMPPMVEIKHVEKVTDRRHVHRHPRVLSIHDRIWQVIATAI